MQMCVSPSHLGSSSTRWNFQSEFIRVMEPACSEFNGPLAPSPSSGARAESVHGIRAQLFPKRGMQISCELLDAQQRKLRLSASERRRNGRFEEWGVVTTICEMRNKNGCEWDRNLFGAQNALNYSAACQKVRLLPEHEIYRWLLSCQERPTLRAIP
jgi:hypothetical protein